jgi:enterochelin esterase family protein
VTCTIRVLRAEAIPKATRKWSGASFSRGDVRPIIASWGLALAALAAPACSGSTHPTGVTSMTGASGTEAQMASGTTRASAGSTSASCNSASCSGGGSGLGPSSGSIGASGESETGGEDASTAGSNTASAPDTGTTDASPSTSNDEYIMLNDPGTEGDGDFTIGPTYSPDPLNNSMASVPVGHQVLFQMPPSNQSAFYTGITGTFTRNVIVYVPQQYVAGTPAPFLVVQDGVPRGQNGANGIGQVWFGRWDAAPPATPSPNLPATANVPNILDNLIAMKEVPPLIGIFVDSGPGDYIGSERGLEYDTVSGKFGDFIATEVLPQVIAAVKTQLSIELQLTLDPEGRATLGLSSGGAASFGMVWWHPEYFNRVITYSGTFVDATASTVFPHGAWVYHDVDPYDAAMPNGLIVEHCIGTPMGCQTPVSSSVCNAVAGCTWDTTSTQPIRMWLEAAQHDNGAGSGPYGDFLLANQRMAAGLKLKGYHYHYDYALGAGHADGNVIAETLPAAIAWVWRGYPIP